MPATIANNLTAPTVGDILDRQPDDLVLVFDTETTGLPDWNAPSDSPGQPHIVSIAAELCAADGTVMETYSEIVRLGVPIPPETTAIHGITDAIANERGIPPKQMLAEFYALVDRASLVVGFNTQFDLRLVRIQSARQFGEKWDCPKPKDDAMWIVAKAMGCRRPKLTDAYQMVFGRSFDGAHSALADCTATREIFFEMRRRGYISENPRAVAGGNNPPADEPAPAPVATPTFDDIVVEIEDLYAEARSYLDGDPIATEGQAEMVAKLRDKIRDAEKRGEAMRKAEAEPLDAAKKAVQDRYNPLVHKDKGKCALAVSTCNSALAPWLRQKEDAQRAAAAKARQEAEDAARAAFDAAQAASTSANVETRERAEDLLGQAKSLLGGAKRAEAAKPQVSGGTRAVGLKSVWSAELVDPTAAIEHYRKARPAELKAWLREQAAADVRAGARGDAIPGFKVNEERVPV